MIYEAPVKPAKGRAEEVQVKYVTAFGLWLPYAR